MLEDTKYLSVRTRGELCQTLLACLHNAVSCSPDGKIVVAQCEEVINSGAGVRRRVPGPGGAERNTKQ